MIYFMLELTDERPCIKIGYSTNDKNCNVRLNKLQVGNPNKLSIILKIDGDRPYEKQLHRRFSDYKVRGEWFALGDELINFIAENNVNINDFTVKNNMVTDHLKQSKKIAELEKMLISSKNLCNNLKKKYALEISEDHRRKTAYTIIFEKLEILKSKYKSDTKILNQLIIIITGLRSSIDV